MAKGIKRAIKNALKRINKEISGYASRDNDVPKGQVRYSGPLASEGYAGGYRQALWDIQLLLNGIKPNTEYWDDYLSKEEK